MKKFFIYIFSIIIILYSLFFINSSAFAIEETTKIIDEPTACSLGGCPSDLTYPRGEKCVNSYTEFKKNPVGNHFWITDQEITSQGKADERARQFIYWVMSRNAIDNHPVLKQIWNTTRNVSYFFTILIAALLGLSIIVAKRTNFDLKIGVWPAIGKIIMALLFITFSASIVLLLIQLSEILMKFFSESLGGKDLFNIYFTKTATPENNYKDFIGCRNLNFKVQEAMTAEVFVLKLTNITYYVMGSMLLLRKIILWFLLFVSPFLAILFSFAFIRNVGWIWIGVFFQWLFYGPLFSIFLGAVAVIWKAGIPFSFDFSRAGKNNGYIYPTAINILYGGPAQQLSTLNNGNYIDTFVEYVITLLMLWTVTILPWWLLRIFRDYCCDGIAAMKNILMSMYDQARGNPPQSPNPIPIFSNLGAKLQVPREIKIPVSIKLETIEEIKKTKTENISQSLNLSVNKLTDIARVETNKQTRETVSRNLQYLTNPVKAETPTQRQKFMNIRTELFNRAVKEDKVARQILTATSSSRVEQMERRQKILKDIPQTKISSSVTNAITSAISNISSIANVAKLTQTTNEQVQNVLNSFTKNATSSPTKITETISKETGVSKEKVATILQTTAQTTQTNQQVVKQMTHAIEPEKHVEETITVPPTVALEDYEEVKKMWKEQYEKGEVPVTENITSRQQWVDQDTIFVTNTLNKLLSSDPQVKNQGLDDIAYILPIFLINNLKGEELMVYLKAKLEAAKAVKESLDREKEITEKLKAQANEQFVDVEKPKVKEAEKTMEMKQELKI